MDDSAWKSLLHRSPNTHKYNFGHVLIIGGSPAMTGAPILAARAALRVGAGLTTIASEKETIDLIDRDIEEIMTLPLPTWNLSIECAEIIQAFIQSRHVSTLIIGPGLPPAADEVIRTLAKIVKLPMVIDAEAFAALSGNLDILRAAAKVNEKIVLTPHAGEYARLTKDQPSYADDAAVVAFARDFHLTVVLKKHPTVIANSAGKFYENTTGNPGLATAGAGDVLAGIIAGIMAQNGAPYESATMATYLHGLAGDIAANAKTQPGMIASDIIDTIPEALQIIDRSLPSPV